MEKRIISVAFLIIIIFCVCSCGKMQLDDAGEKIPVVTEMESTYAPDVESGETGIQEYVTTESTAKQETDIAETVCPTVECTTTVPASAEETVPTATASTEETVPTAPTLAEETVPAAESVTDASNNNMGGSDETGVYWLISSIKSLGKGIGNYAEGFSKTVITLVGAYIDANPDTRFKAELLDVLALAGEINGIETEQAQIDGKYDFPITEMYQIAQDRRQVTVNIRNVYTEEYNDDVLGWLQHQYDAFKNVGRRKMYWSEIEGGEECLIMKAGKVNESGTYALAMSKIAEKTVTVDGKLKNYNVYYEISDGFFEEVKESYYRNKELETERQVKERELDELLNTISEES